MSFVFWELSFQRRRLAANAFLYLLCIRVWWCGKEGGAWNVRKAIEKENNLEKFVFLHICETIRKISESGPNFEKCSKMWREKKISEVSLLKPIWIFFFQNQSAQPVYGFTLNLSRRLSNAQNQKEIQGFTCRFDELLLDSRRSPLPHSFFGFLLRNHERFFFYSRTKQRNPQNQVFSCESSSVPENHRIFFLAWMNSLVMFQKGLSCNLFEQCGKRVVERWFNGKNFLRKETCGPADVGIKEKPRK